MRSARQVRPAPGWQRLGPIGLLALSTLGSLGLLGLRWMMAARPVHRFLAWDLFLAWVPLWLAMGALGLQRRRTHHSPAQYALLLGWALFFPNSPYLLTEFCHLRGPREGLWWWDLMLMLSVAGEGLMLGLLSLRCVQTIVAQRLGERAGWWMSIAMLLGASFGVSLGRFNRFNSWDVARHPLRLAGEIADQALRPSAHPKNAIVTVLLFVFLAAAYALLEMIAAPPEAEPRTA